MELYQRDPVLGMQLWDNGISIVPWLHSEHTAAMEAREKNTPQLSAFSCNLLCVYGPLRRPTPEQQPFLEQCPKNSQNESATNLISSSRGDFKFSPTFLIKTPHDILQSDRPTTIAAAASTKNQTTTSTYNQTYQWCHTSTAGYFDPNLLLPWIYGSPARCAATMRPRRSLHRQSGWSIVVRESFKREVREIPGE